MLHRRDLSENELADFRNALADQIRNILEVLQQGKYTIVGQVPMDSDVIGRVGEVLPDLVHAKIAGAPHAGR